MPVEHTPVRLSKEVLKRTPIRAGRTPERRSPVSGTERHYTTLWENTLVGYLNEVLANSPGRTDGSSQTSIAMHAERQAFDAAKTTVSGIFIDNPATGNEAAQFLTAYQQNHPDRYVYVVAAHLPVITTGVELYNSLNRDDPENDIVAAYQTEGKPVIHEAGKDAPIEEVVETVRGQMRELRLTAYKTIKNAIERGLPVISDRTTERLLVISSEKKITALDELSLTVSDIVETQLYHETDSNVVRIEGPQGAGKTETVVLLREKLTRERVPVREPLSTKDSPMRFLKNAENRGAHGGTMLPFSVRQAAVRDAMEVLALHAISGRDIAVTDRSPYSAALTHLTTSRTSGEPREHGVDASLTAEWMERHQREFEGLTVALVMSDLYQSFFRLRSDPSTDNQRADFTTQFLEHVFYETLVAQGRASRIEVDNKTRQEIVAEITRLPEFKNVLTRVEKQRNTREAIKEWWGEEKRAGVWFSTREIRDLIKDGQTDEAYTRASKLLQMKPDMIYVGAAQEITRDDQEAVIELVKQARADLGMTGMHVKIVDFPSNPAHIAGNGDFAVVVRALNTDDRNVDEDRVRTAVTLLTERKAPYVVGGYVLFDNGSQPRQLPSVAETMNIAKPLNKSTWARPHVDAAGAAQLDFLYFDRGSEPPAGPLPSETISELVGYVDRLQENTRPLIVVGGGVIEPHQAQAILQQGVNTVVYEENPHSLIGLLKPSNP